MKKYSETFNGKYGAAKASATKIDDILSGPPQEFNKIFDLPLITPRVEIEINEHIKPTGYAIKRYRGRVEVGEKTRAGEVISATHSKDGSNGFQEYTPAQSYCVVQL